MSIFSQISTIKKMHDEGMDIASAGEEGKIGLSRWVQGGFWLISFLAIASMVMLRLFGDRDMPPSWASSVGIESFSIMVSAIIYYCYMQDPVSAEANTALFAELLMADTLALFLDEVSWLVQGQADFAAVNAITNTLLYLDNCFIVILFWRYAAFILQIPKETEHKVNRILSVLSILIEIVLVVNFFKPLLFSVDAQGVYRREALFPLALAPVLVVLPPLTRGFMGYNGPEKVKQVAGLFFLLPLIGVALTCAQFGISIQYSAVLLSILLALGVIVAYRGKSITVTRTELGMAARIQESMLPSTFPAFPDRTEFDLCASMDPAREVGGDFYDFFLIDDDHLALLIADVSDKGVPAALMMMSAKILIHYRSCQGGTPAQILTDVNNELCVKNDSGMFVTVWMGILDTRDGTLTCVNAGHENPAVKRSDGTFRLFHDKHGLPLGVMGGMRYQDYTLQFNPGDSVFVYTDGVPEANNPSEELYGFQRLERTLAQLDDPSPQDVLKAVQADVDEFVGDADQFDDLTMLCMKYQGKRSEATE